MREEIGHQVVLAGAVDDCEIVLIQSRPSEGVASDNDPTLKRKVEKLTRDRYM